MTLKNSWKMIWNIPRLLKQSWIMLRNPRVAKERKLILVLLGLGYFLWPLDIIPDFPIPFLGQIDDLGVIFFLLNWFVNRSVQEDSIEVEYYTVDEEDKLNNPKK